MRVAARHVRDTEVAMEYDDKVSWLRRYLDAQRRERVLAEEVERLRAEAERVTPLLSGMPGGGPNTDKLPAAVGRIIDAQQELEAQINCCHAIRREVVAAINTVTDDRQHEVLHRRYILGQRWDQIAVEMHYCYKHVRRIHHRAIDVLKCP